MYLLANDLSVHGQFTDASSFREAIGNVMAIRQTAQRYHSELYCHRNLVNARVTGSLTLPQVIQTFSRDQQQAVMQWLTRYGPFWDDARRHSGDDYLECNGAVVTDTAVGEAAYCRFYGDDRNVISFVPSSWEDTPLNVVWHYDGALSRQIEVPNYWDAAVIEAILRAAPTGVASWEQLALACEAQCPNLTFIPGCFDHLRGCPFSAGAAHRIRILLDTLDQLRRCYDENGSRTAEGQLIYNNHFVGDKAWFSDSSDTEKNEFRTELTFRHNGQDRFCPWHGKVKSPQLRIHFSWPVGADEPLYIAYVGQKITKR